MAHGTVNMNIRHRVGMLGQMSLFAAYWLSKAGIRLPIRLVIWCVNRSSFVSINGGRWTRVPLGLGLEDAR